MTITYLCEKRTSKKIFRLEKRRPIVIHFRCVSTRAQNMKSEKKVSSLKTSKLKKQNFF